MNIFSSYRLLFYSILLLFVLGACQSTSKSDGRVHFLSSSEWSEPLPFGMVLIDQGSFMMGSTSGEDLPGRERYSRQVSVGSFWMDDTEITNGEYKNFVNWVRDSIAVTLSFDATEEYMKKRPQDDSPYDPPQVDWMKSWSVWGDDDQLVKDALEPLYYPKKEAIYGRREIDTRKLLYNASYIDLRQAAKASNRYNYDTKSYDGDVIDHKTGLRKKINSRADFIVEKFVPVYPDTLVWIRDFTFSYNDPWAHKYFWHPAFENYPVVGITYEQAEAFCKWRTSFKQTFLKEMAQKIRGGASSATEIHEYRLPTEAEWEYAARGGLLNPVYPWGGPYTSTCEGCYKANFKPKRGDYKSDAEGSTKTVAVGSYLSNDYGLYDMAGNVAEWTSTNYNPSLDVVLSDIDPTYNPLTDQNAPPALKRKVIRGGSWKDIAYYMEVSSRDFEYADSAMSSIGFRCVMTSIPDDFK